MSSILSSSESPACDCSSDGPSPSSSSRAHVRADWLTASSLAVAFLLIYIFLGQHTFYKADGSDIVLLQEFGIIRHPMHAAYMPALASLRWLLQPLGYTTYESAVLFSALGTALGVFFVSLGFATVLRPARSVLGTLLVAACPVNAFFATVVEFHGPFFACAGLAFYVALRTDLRSRHWSYMSTGIMIGFASLAHSSALLLCLPCFAWILYRRNTAGHETRGLARSLIAPVTAMFVALGVSLVCMRIAAELGYLYPPVSRYDLLASWIKELRAFSEIGDVLREEWLMPMMPISILSLAALIRPKVRRLGVALLTPLLPFLAFTFVIAWGSEHGAYLAPLSIPLAFLTARTFPTWFLSLAVLLSLGFAIHDIRTHDKPHIAALYAQGSRGISGDRPALYLVGNRFELEAVFIGCPSVKPFPLYVDQESPAVKAGFPTLESWLGRWKDREIYLTTVGKLFLDDPLALGVTADVQEQAARHRAWLDENFTFEKAGLFERLTPKKR